MSTAFLSISRQATRDGTFVLGRPLRKRYGLNMEASRRGAMMTQLSVSGMTCASCVGHVTHALRNVPGVRDARVNLATERATIEHDAPLTLEDLVAAVEDAGYHADSIVDDDEETRRRARELAARRRLLILAIVCTMPVVALSMFVGTFPEKSWIVGGLTLPVWLIVGWSFHRGALIALRNRTSTMDTLVSLGSTAALALSIYGALTGGATYFETAAAIITLIFIGKYLESATQARSNTALRSLLALRPSVAQRRNADGGVESVSIDAVRIGDRLIIAPGERVAVDAIVESGESSIDRSMLTGESMPVSVGVGDAVEQGTINADGALVVRATAIGAGTRLAQIVEAVRRAQGSTPPIQRLADRIASVFVPTIIAIASLTFIGWMLTAHPWNAAVLATVAVLVVACPCALGLATPTAIVAGVGRGARRGVLFKDADALERTASIDTMVFDKTGTLTRGTPRVIAMHPQPDIDEETLLRLAASIESQSAHPLARAIVGFARERNLAISEPQSVVAERGLGITGIVDGASIVLGNDAFLLAHDIATPTQSEPITRVYVARNGRLIGGLDLGDEVRAQAKPTVDELRALQIESMMVSGDSESAVHAAADAIGLAAWHASMLPTAKAEFVTQLQGAGRHVGFVGDGINDAPALAVADVGFAMGAGSAIAIETAAAALLTNDPSMLLDAIRIARATKRTIMQNLFWAFAYNVILVPLAAFGIVSPIFGAAAMGLSSLFVVGNSLRLGTSSAIRLSAGNTRAR